MHKVDCFSQPKQCKRSIRAGKSAHNFGALQTMVRGQKRKHGDETDDEVTSALKELSRAQLLSFRRELSLQPYTQALRCLEDTCPKMVEILQGMPAEQTAKSLAAALGDWCWSFDATSAEVDAAQQALRTMLEDGRKKLLEALRAGESFCAVVKKYSSKKDGQPLMKLGKTRVMWLLGAGPGESIDFSRKKRPKKRRTRKVDAEDAEDQVSSEDSCGSEAADKKTSETLKFLESIKELQAKRKQTKGT